MSKRDSKGRFVSSGNSSKYNTCKNNKCTCKEAKKSMRDKIERLDAEGKIWTMVNGTPEEINAPYTIIQGYVVPLNPKFLEEYLETVTWAYPDNVKIVHTNEEVEEEEEEEEDDPEECEEPNIVFCFGEDPCEDDPDAPKPVWGKDTEVIHIDAKDKKVWVEKPETVGNNKAIEHFKRLKDASDKMRKASRKCCKGGYEEYKLPEAFKEFIELLGWFYKHSK